MDKQIRKIEKDVNKISLAHRGKHSEKKMNKNLTKVKKELKHLEKIDKKRDKIYEYGAKMMRKKK